MVHPGVEQVIEVVVVIVNNDIFVRCAFRGGVDHRMLFTVAAQSFNAVDGLQQRAPPTARRMVDRWTRIISRAVVVTSGSRRTFGSERETK